MFLSRAEKTAKVAHSIKRSGRITISGRLMTHRASVRFMSVYPPPFSPIYTWWCVSTPDHTHTPRCWQGQSAAIIVHTEEQRRELDKRAMQQPSKQGHKHDTHTHTYIQNHHTHAQNHRETSEHLHNNTQEDTQWHTQNSLNGKLIFLEIKKLVSFLFGQCDKWWNIV